MEEMDILEYFSKNASKKEWDIIQKVYNRELAKALLDFGMQGKETFNLAELATLYIRVVLEKDLLHIMTIDNELGCSSNESAKDMYMDVMKETLQEYEEEEK
nr:MAG TPA: hypothetical protein [Caudoviricetes sp.]